MPPGQLTAIVADTGALDAFAKSGGLDLLQRHLQGKVIRPLATVFEQQHAAAGSAAHQVLRAGWLGRPVQMFGPRGDRMNQHWNAMTTKRESRLEQWADATREWAADNKNPQLKEAVKEKRVLDRTLTGMGEAAVITLAEERGAVALIDDARASRYANRSADKMQALRDAKATGGPPADIQPICDTVDSYTLLQVMARSARDAALKADPGCDVNEVVKPYLEVFKSMKEAPICSATHKASVEDFLKLDGRPDLNFPPLDIGIQAGRDAGIGR